GAPSLTCASAADPSTNANRSARRGAARASSSQGARAPHNHVMAARAGRAGDETGMYPAVPVARRRGPALVSIGEEAPSDREMALVCEALCSVERGIELDPRALPRPTAVWFLEN